MYEPDQIDWKIITLLNEDGRLSSAEISRKIGGVSARTVTNRIDVLTEQGIINIRSIVNPEALGYCVLADVFVEVDPSRLREVAEQFSEMPLVSYVACATGDTDIILSVRATDIKEMYDFVLEEVGQMPGVRDTRIHLLPLKIKDNASWIPPSAIGDEEEG